MQSLLISHTFVTSRGVCSYPVIKHLKLNITNDNVAITSAHLSTDSRMKEEVF